MVKDIELDNKQWIQLMKTLEAIKNLLEDIYSFLYRESGRK